MFTVALCNFESCNSRGCGFDSSSFADRNNEDRPAKQTDERGSKKEKEICARLILRQGSLKINGPFYGVADIVAHVRGSKRRDVIPSKCIPRCEKDGQMSR